MIKEWHHYPNLVSTEVCEKLIADAIALDKDFESGKLSNSGYVDKKTRKSEIKFIQNEDPFSEIFDIFWNKSLDANEKFFNFHLSRLEYLQFSKYDSKVKGEFKEHQDVDWINDDPIHHRKLSVILQLSDPTTYTGGDLILKSLSTEMSPNSMQFKGQGTLIVFPSFLFHRVLPVTSGVRHSLVGWIEGNKWS